MTCCAPDIAHAVDAQALEGAARREELVLASRIVGEHVRQTDLSVPGIHCGACMQNIETALGRLAGVERARVNLSTKRVSIRWDDRAPPPPLMDTLAGLGYASHIYDPGAEPKDETLSALVRALAVAGFAAGNIMLLSVSIWSGADPATRDTFHWISALIALPALAYAGRIFFHSAWQSLKHGRTNMDVPISLGVLLAFGMSVYETLRHGEHAYFDASVSLLFFLLIGRVLDHMMRERARDAVKGLARLSARGALVLRGDGSRDYVPSKEIEPGMTILLAAGERVPVDAHVLSGRSDLDLSLVSGESEPVAVGAGSALHAGTLNLTGPLTILAKAAAKDSFLAEMIGLMEAAESGRSRYRRIADRAARLYAPAVHLLAFLSFLGWLGLTGDLHRAVTIAVAVLVITCPCALGLAVPMVQVVAARRLFENGIMVRDGSAMERLAEIDRVVFDKTGTLTLGRPHLANAAAIPADVLAFAGAIAAHSRHPHSRTVAAAASGLPSPVAFDAVAEHPGLGLEATVGNVVYRLGRAEWALAGSADRAAAGSGTVLAKDGRVVQAFLFDDEIRPHAREAIAALAGQGLPAEILSGDRPASVSAVAAQLGLRRFRAAVMPADKVAHMRAVAAAGGRALMVGDGLNDAPALAAAHVSMAPGSAADIGRNAADLVFLRDNLDAVPLAVDMARRAGRLIRQNFGLAVGYNALAVPLAISGHVTPLVAALAMSLSSIVVVGNSLRLRGPGGTGKGRQEAPTGRALSLTLDAAT